MLRTFYGYSTTELQYEIKMLSDGSIYSTTAKFMKFLRTGMMAVAPPLQQPTPAGSSPGVPVAKPPVNPCECGAWAIRGFENSHSDWCPVYKVIKL